MQNPTFALLNLLDVIYCCLYGNRTVRRMDISSHRHSVARTFCRTDISSQGFQEWIPLFGCIGNASHYTIDNKTLHTNGSIPELLFHCYTFRKVGQFMGSAMQYK